MATAFQRNAFQNNAFRIRTSKYPGHGHRAVLRDGVHEEVH